MYQVRQNWVAAQGEEGGSTGCDEVAQSRSLVVCFG